MSDCNKCLFRETCKNQTLYVGLISLTMENDCIHFYEDRTKKITRNQTKPEGSDCTAPYSITLEGEFTIRDFVLNILIKYPNEWGYFGIKDGKTVFGNPHWEYKSMSMNDKIPEVYLDSIIQKITASGGWSRMDYLIEIVSNNKELDRFIEKINQRVSHDILKFKCLYGVPPKYIKMPYFVYHNLIEYHKKYIGETDSNAPHTLYGLRLCISPAATDIEVF